jgi:hypothetical protein
MNGDERHELASHPKGKLPSGGAIDYIRQRQTHLTDSIESDRRSPHMT